MTAALSWPPNVCIDCARWSPIGYGKGGGGFNPRCTRCHDRLSRSFMGMFASRSPRMEPTEAQKAHRAFLSAVRQNASKYTHDVPYKPTLSEVLGSAVYSAPTDVNGIPAQLYRTREGAEIRIFSTEWASRLAWLQGEWAGRGWGLLNAEIEQRTDPMLVQVGKAIYDLDALIEGVATADSDEEALRLARVRDAEADPVEVDAATEPGIVKWAGGKRDYARQIVGLLLADGNAPKRYVEPFAGGLAIYFALRAALLGEAARQSTTQPALSSAVLPARTMPQAVLSDFGEELVNTWQQVQADPGIVTIKHNAIRAAYEAAWTRGSAAAESFYYELRERHASFDKMPAASKAAWFLALNRLGFNGLWRVNKAGRNNVPWGKASPEKMLSAGRIMAASAALQGASITRRDFRVALTEVQKDAAGTVVFLDPPYSGTFDAYTAGGFGQKAQEDLAMQALLCAQAGARVVITLNDAKEIRDLYTPKHWIVNVTGERRAINRDAKKRGGVSCVVISSRRRGKS